MNQELDMIRASASGKLILSGEHAAVYGRPALAMATRCKAAVEITKAASAGVHFDLPGLDYHLDFTPERLSSLYERLSANYHAFLAGTRLIHSVLDHPIELIPFAFASIWRRAGEPDFSGMRMGLDITIPIGCGMGSSAAVGISVLKAAAETFQVVVTDQEIYELSMRCEQLMHGHPSGVDSSVSLYGGAFRFEGGVLTPRTVPDWGMTLLNTGRPSVSTGECVESVRSRFAEDDGIWSDFEFVTNRIDTKLSCGIDSELIECVRENHLLLRQIGVVPDRVQTVITDIEAMGGAAKICGAGAVRGENAGVIMVIGDCDSNFVLRCNGLEQIGYC